MSLRRWQVERKRADILVPRTLVACMVGLLLVASVSAYEANPVVELRTTNQKLLQEVNDNRDAIEADVGVARSIVRRILTPKMDLERTSRWVLGKAWRRADDGQKARFVEEFRTLLIRTYASALTEITDVNLEYLPLDNNNPMAKDVTVKTQIISDSAADPRSILYRMSRGIEGWKVYDVTVDGVSLVTTYRVSFRGIVKSDGMDALIDAIATKNRETL